MKITSPELEIPTDKPFENDALQRAKLEPPLSEIVTQSEDPFVLAIDGAWGTGKTTFIKMWKAKLERRGHLCLYFNAWETDFAVDPLVALIGELEAAVKLDEQKKPALSKAFDKVKKIGGSVLRHSIPGMVRLATAGAVELSPAVEAELAGAAASFAEEQLKTYQESKKSLKAFRERLTELAGSVQELANDPSAKLVFFVDELDRCRPTYAIEVLERIKHLFDVPGVVFVLGVDRSQLSHSVRSVYGQDFDATGYLRRFIDLDYVLPISQHGAYCAYLFNVFNIRAALEGKTSVGVDLLDIKELLEFCFEAARLSLRDQRQVLARLHLAFLTCPRGSRVDALTFVALAFIRHWRYDLYSEIRGGGKIFEALTAAVEEIRPGGREALGSFEVLLGVLLGVLGEVEKHRLNRRSLEQAELQHYFPIPSHLAWPEDSKAAIYRIAVETTHTINNSRRIFDAIELAEKLLESNRPTPTG